MITVVDLPKQLFSVRTESEHRYRFACAWCSIPLLQLLLERGFSGLMDSQRLPELKVMYQLFQRVQALDEVRTVSHIAAVDCDDSLDADSSDFSAMVHLSMQQQRYFCH